MRLITSAQCRAARALLEWSQTDLSVASGVHVQTVSNFEKDAKIPTQRTLLSLQRAFENKGIEVTPDGGVRPQRARVIVFNGVEGFRDFRADIVSESKLRALNVCVNNVNERDFQHWGKKIGASELDYRKEMRYKKDLSFRILIRESDTFLHAPYATYKSLPKELFGEISFYIYGDKTAILSFEKKDFNAFIIPHKRITDFYRREFERLWKIAKIVKSDKGEPGPDDLYMPE